MDDPKHDPGLNEVPRWLAVARIEMGVAQYPPGQSNPRITEYHAHTNIRGYDDKASWCSSFVNWCMAQVQIAGTASALARSWLEWGEPLAQPVAGCVAVLYRDEPDSWKGHVGFFLRADEQSVYLLGGNQLGCVCENAYPRDSVLGYRWPAPARAPAFVANLVTTTPFVEIREATADDAEAIAKVHVLSWQAAYDGIMPAQFLKELSVAARAQMWRRSLEARRMRVLLACVDDAVAGWVAFGACRDADKDKQWAEVEALYVLPSMWGKRVGKRLSDAAQHLLHDAGYRCIALWVLAENRRAIEFYRRCGFLEDDSSGSRKTIRMGGAELTEVRYVRGLID
jgi:uncharacterized protein (TIGR02594 family)